jgi:hypothetical protein
VVPGHRGTSILEGQLENERKCIKLCIAEYSERLGYYADEVKIKAASSPIISEHMLPDFSAN